MAYITLSKKFQTAAGLSEEQSAVIEAILNGKQFSSAAIAEKTGYDTYHILEKIVPQIITKLGITRGKKLNGFTNNLPRKILLKTLAQGALNIEMSAEEASLVRGLKDNHKNILRFISNGYTNLDIARKTDSTKESIAVLVNRIDHMLGANSSTLSAAMMRAIDVQDIRNGNSDFENKPYTETHIGDLCIKELKILGLN